MGHVVLNAMSMIGMSKSPRVDTELRRHLDELQRVMSKCSHLTDRERLHVKGVRQLADGYSTPLYLS